MRIKIIHIVEYFLLGKVSFKMFWSHMSQEGLWKHNTSLPHLKLHFKFFVTNDEITVGYGIWTDHLHLFLFKSFALFVFGN